jgi:hypothetical protein
MNNSDPRIDFIIKQVNEAAKEIAPDKPPPEVDAEMRIGIAFGLKIFDRLLPMVVDAAVKQYQSKCRKLGD